MAPPGTAGPGTTAAWNSAVWDGAAWNGRSWNDGALEWLRLGRRGLESAGMERDPHGTDPAPRPDDRAVKLAAATWAIVAIAVLAAERPPDDRCRGSQDR